MDVRIIPSILISIFVAFILLGFICGWVRGLNKSLVRMIMVLCVAVLSYFIIPPITKALLNLDISKFNIVIGSTPVITVNDLILDLVNKIPFLADIVNSSATFATFISLIPQMIVNVVLFVVLFFLIKWFSMIIYWIIAGVCFSKKKMQGKEKHGFIGALIGAVQGLIVAIVVLVPVFGIVETASPLVEATKSQPAATQSFVAYADDSNSSTDEIEDMVGTVGEYTGAIKDSWVYKTLGAIGIKQLSVAMFDGLTSEKVKGTNYSLRREVKTISEAYPDIKDLLDSGFNIKDNATLDALKAVINKLYESPVLSGVVKEVVPSAANIWLDPQDLKFCGMTRPKFNGDVDTLFVSLLESLKNSQGDTIKNDMITCVELIEIANDAGLLETLAGDGNIMDVLQDPTNDHLIIDLISKALESQTLKDILPDIAHTGMNYVYRALDIDPDTISKGEDINPDNIVWEDTTSNGVVTRGEKTILQSIFTNVFNVYDQIKDAADPIQELDFGALGMVFDDIRESHILGPSSWDIMNAFLNSDKFVGADNSTLQGLITSLETNWNNKSVKLVTTFKSLGDALKIARQMKDNGGNLDLKDLGGIIDNFATNKDDPLVQEIVDNLLEPDNLESLGVPTEAAGVVSETLKSVIGHEYSEDGAGLAGEIQAATDILDVAGKVLASGSSEGGVDIAEDAAGIVDSLANSETLLDALTKAESSVAQDLNIYENVNEDSQRALEEAIGGVTDPQVQQKLKDLFGIKG